MAFVASGWRRSQFVRKSHGTAAALLWRIEPVRTQFVRDPKATAAPAAPAMRAASRRVAARRRSGRQAGARSTRLSERAKNESTSAPLTAHARFELGASQ
ncbi:MAG: hypothetical protein U0270_24145 [Labilithrix sp.]